MLEFFQFYGLAVVEIVGAVFVLSAIVAIVEKLLGLDMTPRPAVAAPTLDREPGHPDPVHSPVILKP